MTGLFSYRTNNIGDDFQSYVLASLLKEAPGWIPRDDREDDPGEVTDLIANGFVTVEALPFHPSLRVELLSVWLGPLLLSDRARVDLLGSYGTIGCRDTETLDRCLALGLDARFTGCPTILCRDHPEEGLENGSTLFIDVDPRLFDRGAPHYLIQSSLRRPATWFTNVVATNLDPGQRWRECDQRHRLMTRAELVVTSRIHAALPALGMGRAVIFVEDRIANPGRLTALPEGFPTWKANDCATLLLDPDSHRYSIEAYRRNVEGELTSRIGKFLRPEAFTSPQPFGG